MYFFKNVISFYLSLRQESNPRPIDYKSIALPTELHQAFVVLWHNQESNLGRTDFQSVALPAELSRQNNRGRNRHSNLTFPSEPKPELIPTEPDFHFNFQRTNFTFNFYLQARSYRIELHPTDLESDWLPIAQTAKCKNPDISIEVSCYCGFGCFSFTIANYCKKPRDSHPSLL